MALVKQTHGTNLDIVATLVSLLGHLPKDIFLLMVDGFNLFLVVNEDIAVSNGRVNVFLPLDEVHVIRTLGIRRASSESTLRENHPSSHGHRVGVEFLRR